MYQFFVEEENINEEKGLVFINGSDVNHIKNVVRLKAGEIVRISTGNGKDYLCAITDEGGKEEVILNIKEADVKTTELPQKVSLFVGIPKGERMETVIEKTVELGVYEIIPVEMKRCVVKFDDKKRAAKKAARWQEIARAAAKQSKRSIIPVVTEPVSFKEALKLFNEKELRLVPYENENGMRGTMAVLEKLKDKNTVGVFIGPEGGFEDSEIDALRENKETDVISLGRRILRTDTAPITTMAMIMLKSEMEAE